VTRPWCVMTAGLLVLAGVAGCESDKEEDADIVGRRLLLTGEIDTLATDAAKVLAISTTKRHKMATVLDGRFSLELDDGKPWGVMFLDEGEQALGLLSLGDGLNTLPLHYTEATTDSIDLGVITRDGEVFTPGHNPIGVEIPLTAEQLTVVASADDYLTSLLEQPDVDGSGRLDVLEGRFFELSVIYFIKPGKFVGTALTPSAQPSTLIEGYRLFLSVRDDALPDSVRFTGPPGSPLNGTLSDDGFGSAGSKVYSTPYLYEALGVGGGSFVPVGGVYTIDYRGSTLTFELADQSNVVDNVVYPWPTITLNDDGTMHKVDWTYTVPSGAALDGVDALVAGMQIQIDGPGNKCSSSNHLSDRLYDSPKLSPSETTHTLSCQNILWGAAAPDPQAQRIERVMMTYEDHYGTAYVVMYERSQ